MTIFFYFPRISELTGCFDTILGGIKITLYLSQIKLKGNTMKINETLLRFSGKSAIDFPAELGGDVKVIVKGGIVQETFQDNQDGTKDRILTVKLLEIRK